MIDAKDINKKMKNMPRHLLPEITDYIDFLLSKHGVAPVKESPFDFSWEGGLSESAGDYTSVELQHKASEWR